MALPIRRVAPVAGRQGQGRPPAHACADGLMNTRHLRFLTTDGRMTSEKPDLQSLARTARAKILAYDNQIIGVILLGLAAEAWLELWERCGEIYPYVRLGLYAVPLANILVMVLSAIYVTSVGVIQLFAGPPLARYETLGPNLLSLL